MNCGAFNFVQILSKTRTVKNSLILARNCSNATEISQNLELQQQIKKEDLKVRNELVTKQEVQRFTEECLIKSHTTPENAKLMGELLLEADYLGHHGHGINRLRMYVGDLNQYIVDGTAVPKVLKETVSTAWVDGKNGLGAVVGAFCMDLAVKKAKEVGFSWVVAKRANHYGIASFYTKRALEEGLIGISMCNTSPLMCPTRSAEPALGTNCFAFAAPALSGDSFNLDMSTTSVAMGKVEIRRNKRLPIPLGWALDSEGKMTTDANAAYKAASLMPIGGAEITSGFKGYGLSTMVDICCGILGGANYSTKVRRWSTKGSFDEANLGQCFAVLNPECFAPGFSERLSELHKILRNLTPVNTDDPVLIAGDPERMHMDLVDKEGGIRYSKEQISFINELARCLQIDPIKTFKI